MMIVFTFAPSISQPWLTRGGALGGLDTVLITMARHGLTAQPFNDPPSPYQTVVRDQHRPR